MMMTPPKAKVLPASPEDAINKLIDITEQLMDLMEDESRSVALNDTVLFLSTNKEKDRLAEMYKQAAAEFHTRIEEFRTTDKALIEQLERAQNKLGDLTQANMHTLETATIANA